MSFVNPPQAKTPLLDALRECASKTHAPFYTPGHKLGQGILQQLADCFGRAVFRMDLTELAELDNLFTPQGVIQEAQKLAAEAFGAEHTRFLVNGSTSGVEAAILATCAPSDKIILPRNVHQSAISALILSGAIPVFVNPEYDPVLDIAHSITPDGVSAALEQHPDAKAVLMVYPTYYGVCGDVAAIAQLAHQHDIPLLVDEAHGPHFAFHPDLPTPALASGADLAVQSIHKVLGAMTQASMLHIQGNRIDTTRLSQSLQLLQSTSPSYLLLASLDAARQQMALQGQALMSHTLQLADRARTKISRIPGISVFEPSGSTPGFVALDKTRLTVTVSGLGLTGFEADEILNQQLDVIAELPSLQHLTFVISLGNTEADITALTQAFSILATRQATNKRLASAIKQVALTADIPYSSLISPRDAFFAETETLPIAKSCDRISAESVCPYPPGIPVLIPGEVITSTALDYLRNIQALGGFISGCADSSLSTLKVVKD
ncbi:MAG: aminotransferase class I/II-fold pyridoxal phosphate-dependent enzyme [Chroococcidiopsidaceae cyanobacterium CP_BM_ER_R8_30]|nr:aminotransferase class I/II-fold pyridoxal phosphate-dependent enzyme [Chroococcidiopsidaceae cyanobacterium CP_BM_ER_R8_30]